MSGPTLKCYSWNVNGFRSILGKGFMDWLEAADPDLLNLQEIRAQWDELDLGVRRALESAFDVCWFPSSARKGYAGSATLAKRELGFSHHAGLGIEAYDQEGRIIISSRGKLTFIGGYFPNASTGLVRLPFKRQFARDLAALIRDRHALGEQVILTGDMNVAPEPIDLARPDDNHESPGFFPQERQAMTEFLAAGFVDSFREQHPGKGGLYSWWSYRAAARERNVGWRIDYTCVSPSLRSRVKKTWIEADVMGSDHCPVGMEMK